MFRDVFIFTSHHPGLRGMSCMEVPARHFIVFG
jgi:hypothetical protein